KSCWIAPAPSSSFLTHLPRSLIFAIEPCGYTRDARKRSVRPMRWLNDIELLERQPPRRTIDRALRRRSESTETSVSASRSGEGTAGTDHGYISHGRDHISPIVDELALREVVDGQGSIYVVIRLHENDVGRLAQ